MYTYTKDYYSTMKRNSVLCHTMMKVNSIILRDIVCTERQISNVLHFIYRLKKKTNLKTKALLVGTDKGAGVGRSRVKICGEV